jgi:hypothetical protein
MTAWSEETLCPDARDWQWTWVGWLVRIFGVGF